MRRLLFCDVDSQGVVDAVEVCKEADHQGDLDDFPFFPVLRELFVQIVAHQMTIFIYYFGISKCSKPSRLQSLLRAGSSVFTFRSLTP